MWEVLLCMCCFYWLINKAAFGQWCNRVKPGEKPKQRCREGVGGVRKKPCGSARDRCQMKPCLPVSHSHVAIHRIIEMV